MDRTDGLKLGVPRAACAGTMSSTSAAAGDAATTPLPARRTATGLLYPGPLKGLIGGLGPLKGV